MSATDDETARILTPEEAALPPVAIFETATCPTCMEVVPTDRDIMHARRFIQHWKPRGDLDGPRYRCESSDTPVPALGMAAIREGVTYPSSDQVREVATRIAREDRALLDRLAEDDGPPETWKVQP